VIIGVDLSTRDIATVLAQPDGKAILALRVARPESGESPVVWNALCNLVRQTLLRANVQPGLIARAVVTMDAPLDENGVVQHGRDTEGWENWHLPSALTGSTGIPVVQAETRVVCEGLGEESYGAFRSEGDYWDWLLVNIGSRISGAARVNGEILRGANGVALDVGSVCIDRDGSLGPNGRRGALDAYCGSEAFRARAASYGLTPLNALELWQMPENFAARSLTEDYVRRLAQGIGAALCVLNPPRVVIGGTLAVELGDVFLQSLQMALRDFCAPEHLASCEVSKGQLGHDAAVLGAVALAIES
jgi:glucokinase